MTRNFHNNSRRQIRCLLTYLKGSNLHDVMAAATHFPFDEHGKRDQSTHIGYFVEPANDPQVDVCGPSEDFPF